MGALFVTGTDTGVGKTVVTSALVAALVRRGVRVGVFKPVETGCVEDGNGAPVGEDCVRLARAAGSVQSPAEDASYLFREPAAPLVAAVPAVALCGCRCDCPVPGGDSSRHTRGSRRIPWQRSPTRRKNL